MPLRCLAVGLIMGFLYGSTPQTTPSWLLEGAKTTHRWIDHYQIRRWTKWTHEDAGTVHAGFGRNIWVRLCEICSYYIKAVNTCFVARFFMSVGSVIRTESKSPLATEAYTRARRRPLVMDRHVTQPSNRTE